MSKRPMDAALKVLSRQACTLQQMEERLTRDGFSREEIAECLGRLKGWGYLNDREFGVNRLTFLQRKLKSRAFVENDLLKQGVPSELIKELLDFYYPGELELDIAGKLLEKKADCQRENPVKGYQILARAGFSENTLRRYFPEISPT